MDEPFETLPARDPTVDFLYVVKWISSVHLKWRGWMNGIIRVFDNSSILNT